MAKKNSKPAAKTNGKPATAENAFPKKPRVNRWKNPPGTPEAVETTPVAETTTEPAAKPTKEKKVATPKPERGMSALDGAAKVLGNPGRR